MIKSFIFCCQNYTKYKFGAISDSFQQTGTTCIVRGIIAAKNIIRGNITSKILRAQIEVTIEEVKRKERCSEARRGLPRCINAFRIDAFIVKTINGVNVLPTNYIKGYQIRKSLTVNVTILYYTHTVKNFNEQFFMSIIFKIYSVIFFHNFLISPRIADRTA